MQGYEIIILNFIKVKTIKQWIEDAIALTPKEKEIVKSEWDAVKYGSQVNCGERLWDSICWPITITNNIIPWLVLTHKGGAVESFQIENRTAKNEINLNGKRFFIKDIN